jgi:hypothetical protein
MARSSAEVEKIIGVIRSTLYACPDQRLGQIMVNAAASDLFMRSDGDLLEDLTIYGGEFAGRSYWADPSRADSAAGDS